VINAKSKITSIFVAILVVVSAVLLPFVVVEKVEAQPVLNMVLSTDGSSKGYVGGKATVTITIVVKGVTATVNVEVEGADAYSAAAAALVGVYDVARGKYIAFGVGTNRTSKDWCGGFFGWECYKFEFNYYKSFIPPGVNVPSYLCTSPMTWINVSSRPVIAYDVTHSTWWGLWKSTWTDYYPLTVSATVPCYTVT